MFLLDSTIATFNWCRYIQESSFRTMYVRNCWNASHFMHNLRIVESQANVTLLLGRGQKLNWMILPFLNFSLKSSQSYLLPIFRRPDNTGHLYFFDSSGGGLGWITFLEKWEYIWDLSHCFWALLITADHLWNHLETFGSLRKPLEAFEILWLT